MSFGVPVFQRGLLAVLLLALGCSRAFAGESSDQSILFSAPAGGTLTTNFDQLGLGNSKLQDEIPSLHPFGSTPQSSLSPMPARRAIAPNDGVRELLDRQKDWEVTTTEEAMRNYMVRQALGSRDNLHDDSDNSYQELFSPHTSRSGAATNSAARDSDLFRRPTDSFTDANDSNPFAAMTASPVNPRDNSLAPAFDRSGGLFDLVGGNRRSAPDPAVTLRDQQQQESQLEEFKKILNAQSPAQAQVVNNPSSIGNAYPGLGAVTVDNGRRSALEPIVGTIGSGGMPLTPRSPGVDDFTPRISAPRSPTAPGQSIEDLRAPSQARTKPPEASFDAPLRRF